MQTCLLLWPPSSLQWTTYNLAWVFFQSSNFVNWCCSLPQKILIFMMSLLWSLRKHWAHLPMRLKFPPPKGTNLLATITRSPAPCPAPLYPIQIRKNLHTTQVNFLFPYAALELRTKTGRLESEKYEFLTVTPEGHIYREVQAVSMWSCCDGDDVSAGCKVASSHTLVPRPRRTRVHNTKQHSSRVQRK